jgi:protein-S-isoprenylcysteine O-methyltransferase Ste14
MERGAGHGARRLQPAGQRRRMDKARWVIAVLLMVSLPPAIGGWYLIHPFTRFWRRLGTVASFSIIYSLLIASGVLLWHFRSLLVGRDLGFQPLLLVPAVPAAVIGGYVAKRRRKHLNQRILVGVPEISIADKGRLVREGIYDRTRNPRYLEFLLFCFVYVAFANYSGTWILYLLTFPAIHLVVLLEESELRERFGAEYAEYCRRVPRYVPRRRGSFRLSR